MRMMNLLLMFFAIVCLAMFTGPTVLAQTSGGTGDGCNDDAPDEDGDGIPNGEDPDYIKYEQDGDGYKNGKLGIARPIVQTSTRAQVRNFNRFQFMLQNFIQTHFGNPGIFSSAFCGGTTGGKYGSGICDGTGLYGL